MARLRVVLVLALVLAVADAHGQWQSVGTIDEVVAHEAHALTVRSGPALIQVRVLSNDVVRIRCSPTGRFQSDSSWAVIGPPGPTPEVTLRETVASFELATPAMRVRIAKSPLRISVLDTAGTLITADDPVRGMAWAGPEIRAWKTMTPGTSFFGFGEKAGRLNRAGTAMTMWNSDIPAYGCDTDPLYETIPFFMAFAQGRSYGLFFDNTYRSSFDMGKELDSAYAFGAVNGDLNYYLFANPDPKTILTEFTAMVGRMPLPPLWSLGYQQCRWSYAPEQRLREIAQGFRSRHIPCDVLYLDIDYMDGYRIFTWSPDKFPHPQQMLSDLKNLGFHVAVIVDPGIKTDSSYHAFRSGLRENVFVRKPDNTLFTGKVWPGVCAFPDFTSAKARQWWGDQFTVLTGAGVRGYWNDMNEPSVFDVPTKTIDLDAIHDDRGLHSPHAKSHNIYGMEMTRATYEGALRILPNERPFVLTRASYAGGWRYASAWTGDNVASWEHLSLAASMCLNLGMSGQPFAGSDIGGFIGYPSGELFARWLQLGVFTPLMRAHSVTNEKDKEPWAFGDEFTTINRTTIALRYHFLPYIYTVMEEASRTGVPAMRSLALEFPREPYLQGRSDEFTFGGNVLVAPVFSPGGRTRDVSLPAGTWYDYWSDSVYQGPRDLTVEAPLDRLPLFVKGGTILPTQHTVQYAGEHPLDTLILTIYPGAKGTTDTTGYYEDDGLSFAFREGKYFRRSLVLTSTSTGTTATLTKPSGTYRPSKRIIEWRVKNVGTIPQQIANNGKTLLTGEAIGKWMYSQDQRTVVVRTEDSEEAMVLRVRY